MIALALLMTGTTWAEDFPKDSLKVVDIEEVVVIRKKTGNYVSCRQLQLYCHRKTCRLTK
mgnify:CR=1 FL=1